MKKRPMPMRVNPPKTLAAEEPFAFLSPFPLDECARRLIARNNRTLWGMLTGRAQVEAGLMHAGMNDQQFAVTSVRARQLRGWALGTISDVNGEKTWVTGAVGVGKGALTFNVVGLVLINVAVMVPVLLSGTLLWVVPAFALLCVLATFYHIATARAQVNTILREVFGVPGFGPLPVQRAPVSEGEQFR